MLVLFGIHGYQWCSQAGWGSRGFGYSYSKDIYLFFGCLFTEFSLTKQGEITLRNYWYPENLDPYPSTPPVDMTFLFSKVMYVNGQLLTHSFCL